MHIRPVDPTDDSDLHAFHETASSAWLTGRPAPAFWSEREMAVRLRTPADDERSEPFVAVDGGRPVAAGMLLFRLLDNRDLVFGMLGVLPERRREGIGTAMVDHAVARARQAGRSQLVLDCHYPLDAGPEHPFRRFAARTGFTLANTELHRVLELPVAEDRLRALLAEAAPAHAAYRIETWTGEPPEHLLPSYVRLLNQLAVDAPTGELDFESGGTTVDSYRQDQAIARAQGRTVHVTVATAPGADGTEEAVAHSVIASPPPGADLPNLHQWGTLVRGDHRGHRLGLATKVQNLLAVQRAHPERTLVHTRNSEKNGPMVAINERLGFRPVEVTAEYSRSL